jgi:hypothetical protein
MIRLLLCVVVGLGYLLVREPEPASSKPISSLAGVAKKMTAAERSGLHDAYAILGRAVEADPESEPVFEDTAAVRRAHRAALLVVWKGVFDNNPGKYPGLREALEGEVERSLGTAEVPLNPTLQRQVAKTFLDMSASLK